MVKILLVIGLVFLWMINANSNKGRLRLLYIAVFTMIVREIAVPGMGDLTPSTILFTLLGFTCMAYNRIDFKTWLGFLLFLLFELILGMFYNVDRATHWSLNLFTVFTSAMAATTLIKTENQLQSYAKVIVLVGFIFNFTTIIAYFGYYDGVVIFNEMDANGADATDFHASRIYGICYSNLVQAIAIISICLLPDVNMKSWMKYSIIVVLVVGGLLTLKRMTAISTIFSLAYFIFREQQHGKSSAKYLIMLMLLVVLPYFGEAILYRFNFMSGNEFTDHSAGRRDEMIWWAWDRFKESPIWGNGAGYGIFIHNGVMEILCNCGILGVIFILGHFKSVISGLKKLNPWATAFTVYFLTCFILEASINRQQTLTFMGIYFGGYIASTRITSYNNLQTI